MTIPCAKARGRGLAIIVVSAACWLTLVHRAHALDTCTGTYSASVVHKLPSPNVMQFQSNEDPGATSELGERFIAGMQRAGVVTTGEATTSLSINAMVIPAAGMVSRYPGSYHGFGWALDTSATADSVLSATLEANVVLTNLQTSEISWIASLSCKIQTNDKARVVYSIGEFIGRLVGKDANGPL